MRGVYSPAFWRISAAMFSVCCIPSPLYAQQVISDERFSEYHAGLIFNKHSILVRCSSQSGPETSDFNSKLSAINSQETKLFLKIDDAKFAGMPMKLASQNPQIYMAMDVEKYNNLSEQIAEQMRVCGDHEVILNLKQESNDAVADILQREIGIYNEVYRSETSKKFMDVANTFYKMVSTGDSPSTPGRETMELVEQVGEKVVGESMHEGYGKDVPTANATTLQNYLNAHNIH